jgi:cytochrome c biogenesis protein CcmG/thiol:disulfide interchange protein DsbE
MSKFIHALPLLILIVLFTLFALKLAQEQNKELTLTSKAVPEFSYDLYQPGQALPENPDQLTHTDLVGDVQMVNLFASWCTPCIAEHPNLMTLANQHDLSITGIAYKDDPAAIDNFIKTLGNPYKKIVLDTNGQSFFQWGVTGMPESFILDKTGTIRYHHIGIITSDDINNKILPILEILSAE